MREKKLPENYHLQILKDLVQAWEDINLLADLGHALDKINPISLLRKDERWVPLSGSVCNKFFGIAKPIPNYKSFRRSLEQGVRDDSVTHLPAIPEELREKINNDQVRLVREAMDQIFLAPYLIKEWSLWKKVCLITDVPALKELARTSTCSKLDHMPYDCFLLATEGFPIIWKCNNEEISFNHFFIKREGNDIFITGTPTKLFLMKDDQRQEACSVIGGIENLLKKTETVPKKLSKLEKKRKQIQREAESFFERGRKSYSAKQALTQGTAGIFTMKVSLGTGIVPFSQQSCMFKGFDQECKRSALQHFVHEFMEVLQGFCLSLLPADKEAASESLGSSEKKERANSSISKKGPPVLVPCEWYEVPAHFLNKVKPHKDKNGTTRYYVLQGSEKGPHVRMQHERTYREKDGRFRDPITIRQIEVKKTAAEQGAALRSGITHL